MLSDQRSADVCSGTLSRWLDIPRGFTREGLSRAIAISSSLYPCEFAGIEQVLQRYVLVGGLVPVVDARLPALVGVARRQVVVSPVQTPKTAD